MGRSPYTDERPVPPLALDRCREAGASALRWYEQELLATTDPNGTWQRIGSLVNGACRVAAVAAILVMAGSHTWWVTTLLAAMLLGGLLYARGAYVPTLALMVSLVAVLVGLPESVSAGAFMVALVVMEALRRMSFERSIEADLLAGVLVAVVVGKQSWASTWLVLAVYAVTHIAVEYAQTRSLLVTRSPFVSVTAANARMPAIEMGVPWLTRIMCLNSRQQQHASRELTRKRAGVWGERRTALILLALRRGAGTRIVHDVIIPGARDANIDSIVVAKSGWYVLDTKQYGTKGDPGRVVFDEQRQVVEHVSSMGSRDITGSLRTLMWACAGVDDAKGQDTGPRCRGVLVVHNASVDPGIVISSKDGGTFVDVISADQLPSRIDGSSSILDRSELAASRTVLSTFTAASHGGSAFVASPMGWWGARAPQWTGRQSASMRPQPRQNETWVTPTPNTDTQPIAVRRTTWRDAVDDDSTRVDISALVERGGPVDGWQEVRPPQAVPERRLGTDVDAMGLLDEAWASMEASPLAAPDDVPAELRGLAQGTILVHVVYDTKTNEPVGQDLVLLKGPCEGAAPDGEPYLWVCAPQEWEGYKSQGMRMKPITVKASNVMRRTW